MKMHGFVAADVQDLKHILTKDRLATLGRLVPTLARLHKLASHTMPGTRQETRHLPQLPQSLLRAKCGTPKPPPGPPPSFLVMARQTTTSEPRYRSRTPTRDVRITSLELELLPDESLPAHASSSNRPSSLGATWKSLAATCWRRYAPTPR